MKKILYSLLGVLSLLGMGAKFSSADIPQQPRIENISQSTPLYLEPSSSMQQGGQTLLVDHESHYSHSSHESHSSHSSHSSGY